MKTNNVVVGKHCNIAPSAMLGYMEHGGQITLGDNITVRERCIIRSCTGFIVIGSGTTVNYNCILHGQGNITIGKDVILSPNVQMYAANHGTRRGGQLIREQPNYPMSIIVGDDVWLGANAIVLAGVNIQRGAVIGAGSIVTGHIPAYEIWAGNPAKKVGERE